MRMLAGMLCVVLLAACSTPARVMQPLPGEDDGEGLERARMAVVSLVIEQGGRGDNYGAGVVYDSAGHILTVHHAVEGATRILVLLDGGVTVQATVVAEDPIFDFALLKADLFMPDFMAPAALATSPPRVGDPVWSIGNPFGTSRFGGNASVGRGVVSALDRSYLNEETGRLYLSALQHDAPTNPGNSGGGVFNERGELLGINALITTTRSTASDSGVAFAMPARLIRQTVDKMLSGERVTHGWLGAERYKQATEIYQGGFGRLRAVFGPLTRGGPAEVGGVLPGDVVIRVDDAEVYGLHEMLVLEDNLVPGQSVSLTINRAGREFDLMVRVGDRPWRRN